MKILEVCEKARKFVPFVMKGSRVKYGGSCDLYKDHEAYIKNYQWQNGWRESGSLLLDRNVHIVGKVFHMFANGTGWSSETEKEYPKGRPYYLLEYEVIFDTEEREYAYLYKIKKTGA